MSIDHNSIASQCRDLAAKVSALCREHGGGHVSDVQFVRHLSEYALRGHAILQPKERSRELNSVPYTEPERRTMVREWRDFACDEAMVRWCEEHDCCLTSQRPWRWVPKEMQVIGAICGLHEKRGWPRLTDGVECIIELENDQGIFIGHWAWFEGEKLDAAVHGESRKRRKAGEPKKGLTAVKDALKNGKKLTKDDLLALLS